VESVSVFTNCFGFRSCIYTALRTAGGEIVFQQQPDKTPAGWQLTEAGFETSPKQNLSLH